MHHLAPFDIEANIDTRTHAQAEGDVKQEEEDEEKEEKDGATAEVKEEPSAEGEAKVSTPPVNGEEIKTEAAEPAAVKAEAERSGTPAATDAAKKEETKTETKPVAPVRLPYEEVNRHALVGCLTAMLASFPPGFRCSEMSDALRRIRPALRDSQVWKSFLLVCMQDPSWTPRLGLGFPFYF